MTHLPPVIHGDFTIERDFGAPVHRVFAAWTDVSMKARWFTGPVAAWVQAERAIDVRVGGQETLRGRHDSGVESLFTARYHAVIPDRRLVFAYDMHLDGKHFSTSLATVELTPKGTASTHLAFTEHAAFYGGEDGTTSRRHGTAEHLTRLALELADPRDIVSSRTFHVPRARLFDCFRDGVQLAKWWGPKGFTCVFDVFEPWSGGRWRFTMRGPDGTTYPMIKDFTEVTPERIAYRHGQAGHEFGMNMTFVELGDATHLVWRMRFDSLEEANRVRAFIENANEENFDRLQAHLESS